MASNWGFRSITLVCFCLLTPNLVYGWLTSRRSCRLLLRCLWSRSRSLLLKIEIQFPLHNFSLLWPIYTKFGACNQCNQNNGIIFSTLPSFISYSCHINTWLNRWKPGFVALRRFLYTLLFVCFGKLCYKNKILMNKYWHIIKSNCLRAHNKQRNNPI